MTKEQQVKKSFHLMWFVFFLMIGILLYNIIGSVLLLVGFPVVGFIVMVVMPATPSTYMGFGKNKKQSVFVWMIVGMILMLMVTDLIF